MGSINSKKLILIKRLYYKELWSMKKIADNLNVPWGAVYYFMRRYNLKRRTFSEENKIRFLRKEPSFCIKQNLSNYEKRLKMIGVVLYWSEGSKGGQRQESVDFVNSDPAMMKVFINFLRNICGINEKKLRVLLYCYANQDINHLLTFWSKLTNIPKSQFSKPYVRKDFKEDKKDKMKYGLIHIRYHDKKLFLLIKDWIEELKIKYA